MLKLYIAILDKVPDHMVPVLVAHSMLGAHLKFMSAINDGDNGYLAYSKYTDWLYNSFKKVVVKVNITEFNKITILNDVYLGHENTVLEGGKTCAVVCPREEYPNVIKFAKMWKPNV